MKREILVAESAGFCYGVKRAMELAEKAGERTGRAYTLGPLIHNGEAVRRLEESGVAPIDDPSGLGPGDTVIIRSHGISREERTALDATGAQVVDATCPSVARVHRLAEKESREGRTVVIIGDPGHPEVTATAGWCGESVVFSNGEEAEKTLDKSYELCYNIKAG